MTLAGGIVGICLAVSCAPDRGLVWVVERDMPQSRNLIPVLNRTTLLAAGPGTSVKCAVVRRVHEQNVRPGRFWPGFGTAARMGVPVLVPDGFPVPDPPVLGAPEISGSGADVRLAWPGIELKASEGAAIHADTWLGPPDMFHSERGLSFGDIQVDTEYRGEGRGDENVFLTCRIALRNRGEKRAEGIEFAYFFPRALLDEKTGKPVPLLDSCEFEAEGFSDPEPLDLLVSDGLGRGAWGPRCVLRRPKLDPGESLTCSLSVRGRGSGREEVIVPLVTLMAKIDARYWPSSEVEITPPAEIRFSEYTQFNLVVPDSRLFRIGSRTVTVEASSSTVREFLGIGLEK